MKISDSLRSVQRPYIETAPLIYYIELNSAYIAKMDAIIDALRSAQLVAFSSVIILTEVLIQPLRVGNKKLEQQYRDILQHSREFQLLPVTAQIAESAADLRARYNMRTPDALHVATAIDAHCDAFITNDMGMKRLKEIPVLVLDDLELDLQIP